MAVSVQREIEIRERIPSARFYTYSDWLDRVAFLTSGAGLVFALLILVALLGGCGGFNRPVTSSAPTTTPAPVRVATTTPPQTTTQPALRSTVPAAPVVTKVETPPRDTTPRQPPLTTTRPTTTTPAPTTTPPPPPPVLDPPSLDVDAAVYYTNCAAVRAAGKAPLKKGQPGYRDGLDRDGDGTACDK